MSLADAKFDSDSDSDSDLSSSSGSSSGNSSVFEGDIIASSSSHHLLSPPPLSSPTALGDRDTPLRHRSRSSSFASPLLRPTSNPRSRSGSLLSLDPDGAMQTNVNVITPSSSYQDLANRPRSNPRNRTPMHSTTPVLGPVTRASIANEERANSNERSSRSTTPNNRPTSASRSSDSRVHTVVGLGANLTVGTILRGGSLSALHERPVKASSSMGRQPRSVKQGPGHRKVRRWNNDKFIGIASDISNSLSQKNPQKGMRIANIYAEADMDKGKYTLPHDPLNNRTIFGTLLSANRSTVGHDFSDDDDEDDGYNSDNVKVTLDPARLAEIRERFVDGEVAENNTTIISDAAKDRMKKREEEIYKDGKRMMNANVNERVLNVVIRACKSSGYTRNIVDACEKLLLSLSSDANATDNGVSSSSKRDSDVWKKVLVQKPFITRKSTGTTEGSVTIRLLFSDKDSKAAFNRILLHAVCQFHGLESASSTTSKGHRLMTVTGICKGGNFRFLDYVPFNGVDKPAERQEVSPSIVMKDDMIQTKMATLKVT